MWHVQRRGIPTGWQIVERLVRRFALLDDMELDEGADGGITGTRPGMATSLATRS